MFRTRFYWKVFASYVALVGVTSALLGGLAYSHFHRTLRASFEGNLRGQLDALAAMGPEVFLNPLREDLVRRFLALGKNSSTRVTVIDTDGVVLLDTEADPKRMQNHSDRPEVIEAMRSGASLIRRHSATLEKDQIYASQSVVHDGKTMGVLRAAIPIEKESALLADLTRNIFYGVAASVVIALLLGSWVAVRITKPLNEMRGVAEAMRAGEYHRRVGKMPRNEIGLLGDTLNRLGAELTVKISNLAHEEAQLRAILAGMVEGVIAVDAGDTILYHNRAATKLLGRESDGGLSGKKIWQYLELRGLREVVEQVRENRESMQKEIRLTLEGGDRVLNLHATPFETSVSRGVILVLHDITELRRLESVRRDFVANVSHELKTPLTSIKGYVETLLEGALHDEKANTRFLEKIHKQTGYLTDLVQDLLALGEIESEARRPVLVPEDWNTAVSEVMSRYELEITRRKLSCRWEPGSPVRVLAESEGLHQIAGNLVSNAVKYTPEGGSVQVRCYEKEGFGCLEVVDTGVGIPEKDLPRIFERFYRVDKARSREVGGTGLGLSIVKHLVSTMNGEIRVESRLGGGTKFTVRLPLSA